MWAQAPKKEPPVQWVETETGRWMVHDEARPAPPVVTPGVCGAQETPARPPADAVVLFDGKSLSNWTDMKGQPSKWVVRDGYMESVKGAGYVRTRQEFGSAQLHVEFATPSVVTGPARGGETAASSSRASTRYRCSTPTRTRRTRTASAERCTAARCRW